jgi:Ca2+:H+ antiporter
MAGGASGQDLAAGDGGGPSHASTPALSLSGALASLAAITVIVAVCSEFLTGALEAVSHSSGVNQAFLGLIVLPIAGNAAEHITAVFVAVKDKMDLAIGVSLGSSIQIATFVLPVTVLAGWAMGKELTLDFDPFAVLMLTVSVILAYFVSSDGSSNWLLGLQLVLTYVLIGLVYLLEKEGSGGGGGGGGGGAAAAAAAGG